VPGCGNRIPNSKVELFVANSGTSLRFLTAMVATGLGTYRLDGTPRMRQRPVSDLLMALNGLGSDARSDLGTGCPSGDGAGPRARRGKCLCPGRRLQSIPQRPAHGLAVLPGNDDGRGRGAAGLLALRRDDDQGHGVFRRADRQRARIAGSTSRPTRYTGRSYAIEPDASAASYFFALAAITGGTITVVGVWERESIQGDLGFVDILEHMGCSVVRERDATTVTGGPLKGVDVDMNAISDTVMTLAVVALFAPGGHADPQRGPISATKKPTGSRPMATELRKLGRGRDEHPDGLLIFPPTRILPARIATYDDHRMAMSFAIAGLKAEGITILDPDCVAKTYPGFWNDLGKLNA